MKLTEIKSLIFRASSETKKQSNGAPLKMELQLQPSVAPQQYPIGGPQNPPSFLRSQITTPNPEPFETLRPHIDPSVAESIYRQHQINLNPTYNPLRDQNVVDEQTLNALLYQHYLTQQYPNNVYSFRQNSDGSVSTSRPPWPFNWFTPNNNNNNNNNYQSDQPQQGPILSFFNNLAQNNPITSFINGIQQNDQPQNPFQNFLSNINPLNLFSNNNNNRPQQTPTQSDYVATNQYASNNLPSNQYVSTLSSSNQLLPNNLVSNQLLSNNLDSSVFSNDPYHPQNQVLHGGNYAQSLPSPGFNHPIQSVNFNPGSGNPTPLYNPGFNPNPFLGTTNRPSFNPQFSNQAQPYSLHLQNPSSYPIYQNPYQSISPLTITSNPNFNQKKRKTSNKTSKKKNRNKVDVPDSDSDWFQGFLDKRKEASLELSSRRPNKKKSEDDDDDSVFDDYFR